MQDVVAVVILAVNVGADADERLEDLLLVGAGGERQRVLTPVQHAEEEELKTVGKKRRVRK